jgi:hypothetical protein
LQAVANRISSQAATLLHPEKCQEQPQQAVPYCLIRRSRVIGRGIFAQSDPLAVAPPELRIELKKSNYKLLIAALAALAVSPSFAQVASHAATPMKAMTEQQPAPPAKGEPLVPPMQISNRPVARVNGAVLTDRDLLREMYSIFPYARQHNGFPKADEAKIRRGALSMIEFEELVYQDAERRKMQVPTVRSRNSAGSFPPTRPLMSISKSN